MGWPRSLCHHRGPFAIAFRAIYLNFLLCPPQLSPLTHQMVILCHLHQEAFLTLPAAPCHWVITLHNTKVSQGVFTRAITKGVSLTTACMYTLFLYLFRLQLSSPTPFNLSRLQSLLPFSLNLSVSSVIPGIGSLCWSPLVWVLCRQAELQWARQCRGHGVTGTISQSSPTPPFTWYLSLSCHFLPNLPPNDPTG